jgi:hypothetical protein
LRHDLHDDEEYAVIAPAEMPFLFEMGRTECHQKLTGICSLDRKSPDKSHDIGDECDYDYCPRMLRSLKKDGQIFPVRIIRWRCGHFGFHDGQHRVCIAKRKGLKLDAVISWPIPDEDCEMCSNRPCRDGEIR